MNSSNKTFRPKARSPRGFEDRWGDGLLAEQRLIEAAISVYRAHGFQPLETSAFEYADALGKFLPDEDRPNEGVFALQDDDEQWLALRYDLTAPLARFVAENYDGLPKPFRRYAAGRVWRNEKPGPGRFREFTQCDADTVGAPSPLADAEMIAIAAKVMRAAGLGEGDYVIKVNDRRCLDALMARIATDATGYGQEQRLRVLRAIDKLDRLGEEGVARLLGGGRKDESGDYTEGAKLDPASIDAVLSFVKAGQKDRGATLGAIETAIGTSEPLKDLRAIDHLLTVQGMDASRILFDPSIVRGLGYYTGPVFEAEVLFEVPNEKGQPIRVGSVGSGGRYDDLVSRFKGIEIPATGFSFGVSRFAAALRLSGRLSASGGDALCVFLIPDDGALEPSLRLAASLRERGFPAEIYTGASGFRAQMKYADKRDARFAIILGEDERASGSVTVKDLHLGRALSQNIETREEWQEARPAQETIEIGQLEQWLEDALK
jgi:histidyl-tRNA synthetase